jgi:hypothetical protein
VKKEHSKIDMIQCILFIIFRYQFQQTMLKMHRTSQELITYIFIDHLSLCLCVLLEQSVGILFHLEYFSSYPFGFLAFPHFTDKEQLCLCRKRKFTAGENVPVYIL